MALEQLKRTVLVLCINWMLFTLLLFLLQYQEEHIKFFSQILWQNSSLVGSLNLDVPCLIILWDHTNLCGIFYSLSGIFYSLSGTFYSLSGIFYSLSGTFYSLSGIFYSLSGIFYSLSGTFYSLSGIFYTGSCIFYIKLMR